MTLYLQTCPITQVYQANNYTKHQLALTAYEPPTTYLQNLSIYEPYPSKRKRSIPNTKSPARKPKLAIPTLEQKPKLKLIPATKSYIKENLPLILYPTEPALHVHKFSKEKRSHSYIPKENVENVDMGPGKYNPDEAFRILTEQNNFQTLSHIDRPSFRRRIHTEDIMAKSLHVPGVGQYNIANAPTVKLNCLSTQWEKRPQPHQIKKSEQKHKQKRCTPSPNSYNALPRSYSLFSTLKFNQKQNRKFVAYYKEQKIKQQTMKQNRKGKNLNGVGPGKYLTLDDWRQKFKDKKGANFVAKPMPPSVYY